MTRAGLFERLEPAEDLRLLRGEPFGGGDHVGLGCGVDANPVQPAPKCVADAAFGALPQMAFGGAVRVLGAARRACDSTRRRSRRLPDVD